jgi:pimeloyl-ACP methyl ester carboxylesterase
LAHDRAARVQERGSQGAVQDAEKLYEPQAMLKLAQRRMPGLEAAIVPGADHIAAMSQPEDVNGQIIRFLQKGGADKNGGR